MRGRFRSRSEGAEPPHMNPASISRPTRPTPSDYCLWTTRSSSGVRLRSWSGRAHARPVQVAVRGGRAPSQEPGLDLASNEADAVRLLLVDYAEHLRLAFDAPALAHELDHSVFGL